MKTNTVKNIRGHEDRHAGHLGEAWKEDELQNHEGELDEGIGIFFGFATAAFLFFCISIYVVLYLVSPRLLEFHPMIPKGVSWVATAAVAFFALGLLLSFLTVVTGRNLFPSFMMKGGRNKGLIMFLTPLAVRMGGVIGISRDRVASSFVKVNNALVIAGQKNIKAKSLLILLPRCIQHSNCKQKVEIDISNCKDCGLCDIADIIRICENNGIEAFVATGGNIARKMIKEKRPSGVIGVACERELLSGLHDTWGLPVLGIPNLRPEGPCIDTRVNLEKLDKAVKTFLR